MDLFVATEPDGSDFYGTPALAPGARCVFAPELLFAASPPPRELHEFDGMVVHEDPRKVLWWPCRLWRVKDVDQRRWCSCPRDGVFRCRELTVVEEVPSWLVFGPLGDQVVTIIEQAGRLTQEQVNRLVGMDGTAERDLYEKHWDGGTGNSMLPVDEAIKSAARRVGDHLFARDPERDLDYLADPAWIEAQNAAIAAAWGAEQEAYTPIEREVLARRWSARGPAHT